jgi:hypothetical protein
MTGEGSTFIDALARTKEIDKLFVAEESEYRLVLRSHVKPTFKVVLNFKKNKKGKELRERILALLRDVTEVTA